MGRVIFIDNSVLADSGVSTDNVVEPWRGEVYSEYCPPDTEVRMPGPVRVSVLRASNELLLVGEKGRVFRLLNASGIYERLRDIYLGTLA